MPRPSPYTEAQKAAILDAVKSGRKAGKKWPEIHAAATEAGYKGGLQYLMKLASNAGAVRGRRGRKVGTAVKVATAAAAKGKRGRPKGSKNVKRAPGRPKAVAAAGNGVGLGAIDKIVAQMVEQRVGVAVTKAVEALEAAARELSAL